MSVDLLIDSHVLLWLADGDPRGRAAVGDVLDDPASTATISAASYFEIAVKRALGKVHVDTATMRRAARLSGMLDLAITAAHAEQLEQLPMHHGDPFDRMLIAQARAEELTIVTVDAAFAAYDVPLYAP